jgi:hypothetical protein
LKQVRWFSYRLTPQNAEWAFAKKGEAYRAISAIELYASLLCITLFMPDFDKATKTEMVLRGTTDNQSNEGLVNRHLTTKYPAYIILMELTEQLSSRNLLLDMRWQSRSENQHADDLSNEVFTNFAEQHRIDVPLDKLPWKILPQLVSAASELNAELTERKARRFSSRTKEERKVKRSKKKSSLRVRDPW